jgi:hypothetical protein
MTLFEFFKINLSSYCILGEENKIICLIRDISFGGPTRETLAVIC